MIYSQEVYQLMVNHLLDAIRNGQSITFTDALTLSVSYNTIISLYSQLYMKESKKVPYVFQKMKTAIIESLNSSSNDSKNISLLQLMEDNRSTSYYRLAKFYIEERFTELKYKITDFLMDPSIIPEVSLRNELLTMISRDLTDAPSISVLKESMGKEYEQLLVRLLDNYHFVYETESDMRKKGKPKTPDIWFTIPMATIILSKYETRQRSNSVLDRDEEFVDGDRFYSSEFLSSSSMNHLIVEDYQEGYGSEHEGFNSISNGGEHYESDVAKEAKGNQDSDDGDNYVIINWIDSKAMFADLETFKEHYSQLHGYYLRYGPGMVIYWHGLVEDIYSSELYDGNIIVRDCFPEKWLFPNGAPAIVDQAPVFDDKEFESLP
jgi:hypothetical protein